MLAAAGNANFAAHVKSCRLRHKLLQSSVGSACNRARADMGFRNNALALRRNNGTLHNFNNARHKLAAKIYRRAADTLCRQLLFYALLLRTVFGNGNAQCRTPYFNARQFLFCHGQSSSTISGFLIGVLSNTATIRNTIMHSSHSK